MEYRKKTYYRREVEERQETVEYRDPPAAADPPWYRYDCDKECCKGWRKQKYMENCPCPCCEKCRSENGWPSPNSMSPVVQGYLTFVGVMAAGGSFVTGLFHVLSLFR